MTQSAASQRVSQLEKALGVKLLDRSVRPLKLTEAGRVLLEGGSAVLQQLDVLTRRVSMLGRSGGAGESPIRVRAIYSAGIAWLNAVRAGFEEAYGRGVEVEYDGPAGVCAAMEQGRADVGVVSFPGLLMEARGVAGELAWRPLREEEMCVVCPPGHDWSREPAVSARHLVQGGAARGRVEMLAFDPALPVGAAVRDYLRHHGVEPTLTHTFDNLDTLKAAVLGTGKPAILPRRCVAPEVAAGQLAAVTLRPTLHRPIAALFKPQPATGAAARAKEPRPDAALAPFLGYLAKHANPDTATDAHAGRPRVAGAA